MYIQLCLPYTDLLTRHIDKEDRVVYTFAQRELKDEIMDEVNSKCMNYESEHKDIRNKYIDLLEKLENKYLT